MEVFTFEGEDHTLGSLLQQELLENKKVEYAGYIDPHPFDKKIKLKIQTKKIEYNEEDLEENDRPKYTDAREVLREAIENIKEKLYQISKEFDNKIVEE
jgi:DNA-directed RNA polymerase II subunit RPB11